MLITLPLTIISRNRRLPIMGHPSQTLTEASPHEGQVLLPLSKRVQYTQQGQVLRPPGVWMGSGAGFRFGTLDRCSPQLPP